MFNLCNVLQFIIGRFNQGSFSGLNLVSNTYQGVSHIVFDLGDEWYTEFLEFTLPVFLTFNQVKEEEVNITRAYLQIKVNHYPSYVRIVSLS